MNGPGTVTMSTSNSYTGATTVSGGTLNLSAADAGSIVVTGSGNVTVPGTLAAPGLISVGTNAGDTAVLSINSSGVLNATKATAPSLQAGTGASGSGTITLSSGGTLNTASELWISTASGVHGEMDMTGGVANIGSWLAVGRGGSDGNLNVAGGLLTVASNSGATNLTIASFAGNQGQVTVSGGTVNALNSIYVGESGIGTMTVSGSGVAISTAALFLGRNSGANGTLELDGGAAYAPSIATAVGATSILNFNGGTIIATSGSTPYIGAITTINVRNGTSTFNNGGFNATIASPLAHSNIFGDNATDGGMTFTGSGITTLTAGNSYNGPTNVNGGAVIFPGSSTIGSLAINAAGAAVSLVDGTINLLNLAGGLSLVNSSVMGFEIGNGQNDMIAATGAASATGISTINLASVARLPRAPTD